MNDQQQRVYVNIISDAKYTGERWKNVEIYIFERRTRKTFV